jgi:beta-barrel assembly-enhancing protease
MRRSHSRKHSLRTILLAVLLAGCAGVSRKPLQPGPAGFPQAGGFNAYSPQQDVQLGKQVAAEADAQLPMLPDSSEVSRYVSALGQKLARQLPSNPFQFNFRVVNQKEINAFALPGGPVRVNLGTIQSADNEAQLAGVIAHEIAHVYMRHSTRNASKQAIASIPLQVVGAMLGDGVGGQLARLGIQFGAGSIFLKYSRDAESEADRVGAKIMYEAGYDPRAMAQFFEKLEGETAKGGPQFLSDHPNPGNRAGAVMEEISALPPRDFTKNTPQFQRIKELALQMHPYTAEHVAQMQKQKRPRIDQLSSANIQPANNFTTLNGSGISIQYPENWRVYDGHNSALVAPPAGVQENAIAYGVMISGYTPQQPTSLEEATQLIANALRQANPGMRAGSAQRVSVNGMPAIKAELTGESPLAGPGGQPVDERDVLITVQRSDGTVVWLLFIAPEPEFAALQPTFQRMIDSLRVA